MSLLEAISPTARVILQACELRPGIGLCDECALPKWPQQYVGYGCMLCLDCLNKQQQKANNHVKKSN